MTVAYQPSSRVCHSRSTTKSTSAMSWIVFFIIFLSCVIRAKSQVALNPSNQFVSVPGGTARFMCTRTMTSIDIESVEWLLNGTLLDNFNFNESDVTQRFISGFGIGELIFNHLPLTSQTTNEIVCRAALNNGETALSTATNLIVLQGLLSAVGSLMDTIEGSNISLTWTAPSTQEEIDVDPVINGYCVDVATSLSTLASLCGITETMFSFPIDPDMECDNYTFTVTPVSPGGNGTSAAVEVTFPLIEDSMFGACTQPTEQITTTQKGVLFFITESEDNSSNTVVLSVGLTFFLSVIVAGVVAISIATWRNRKCIAQKICTMGGLRNQVIIPIN